MSTMDIFKKLFNKLQGFVYQVKADLNLVGQIIRNPKWLLSSRILVHWKVENLTKGWCTDYYNLVVNEGLDYILDSWAKGSGYTAAFYIGLTNGTPSFAAGDTMASHAGWTENTNYDEAVRQTLTLGTVSGQSVDNSSNKAVFTIDTNGQTLGGAFMTTDSTKGGTSGTLIGGSAFSGGDKSADDNDVLNVTVTLTQSAS